MTPEQSIKNLTDGNARHAAGIQCPKKFSAEFRQDLCKNGQKPYAAIVGCSDSRVPVEIVFDSGMGELFVIRTAGNIVGSFELGSLEFAVAVLKVPLILVLGHDYCGAVKEAADSATSGAKAPEDIEMILKEIRSGLEITQGKTYADYEDENIRHTLSKIAADPIMSKYVSQGDLRLAAAKYSLETGIVSYFN